MKAKKYFFIIGILITLIACKKDNDILDINPDKLKSAKTNDLSKYQPEELIQIYNLGMHEFAKAFAKTLKNQKVKESIKEEALLRRDGDFDIIWKGFKDQDIEGESIIKKVARNVSKQISENEKLQKIEDFSGLFKQLQISVPIHIDKWLSNYPIPVVAFREVTEDGVRDFLYTYDAEGNQGRIEKGIIPDYPVLVININERSDENGDILLEYDQNFQTILKAASVNPLLSANIIGDNVRPSLFSGSYVNNSILLSWELNYSGVADPYIMIERDNGSGFQVIAQPYANIGSDNYFDLNVQQGQNYTYRIRAKYIDDSIPSVTYSSYTNSITISTGATGIPDAPTNFVISAKNPNEFELTWEYPITSNITGFKVSKRIVNSGQDFDTPINIPASSRYYLDLSNKTIGAKYQYKLIAYNSISQSSEILDVSYNPYRNYTDYLYITKLEFPDLSGSGIEDWDLGDPEIQITVSYKDSPTSPPSMHTELSSITMHQWLTPRSTSYPNSAYGYNVDVIGRSWETEFYKSVININFIEHDGYNWLTGWKNISLKVKVPIKVLGADITIEAAADIVNNVKNTEFNIGDACVAYWDPCVNYRVQVLDRMYVTFSKYPNP